MWDNCTGQRREVQYFTICATEFTDLLFTTGFEPATFIFAVWYSNYSPTKTCYINDIKKNIIASESNQQFNKCSC